MPDIHRICPDCGEDFQAHVELCPDCGVTLRWSTDFTPGPRGLWNPGLPPLEPSPDLLLIRFGGLEWVRALAERLAEVGIRALVSPVEHPAWTPDELVLVNFQHNGIYHLFVRQEDLDASLEVSRAHLAHQLGDEEPWTGVPTALGDSCPACRAYVPKDATECPACELSFRWPEEEDGEMEET